jgi:hypothetical protein
MPPSPSAHAGTCAQGQRSAESKRMGHGKDKLQNKEQKTTKNGKEKE